MPQKNIVRFKLPQLFDADADINKRWFVYYSFLNDSTHKLERFKVYGAINKQSNLPDRYKIAEELILKYSDQLKKGFNPFDLPDQKKEVLQDSFYLANIIIKYLEKRKQGLRRKTVFTYESKVNNFVTWIDQNYKKIELKHFDKEKALKYIEYLRKESKSNTTVNNYIIILKSLFDDLVNDDLMEKNPFFKIKKIWSCKQGKLPFKLYQRELLKEAIIKENKQLWLFVQFIYYCFIRPGELRNLKIEAIDIDQGIINIDGMISKNKKTQSVGIPLPLIEELKKQNIYKLPGNYFVFGKKGLPGPDQVAINYFSNEHRKITRALNFSGRYSLYSWKSTGAVNAVKAGLGLKDIQLQLRHSSLEMTDIYLQSIGVLDNKAIMNNFPEL